MPRLDICGGAAIIEEGQIGSTGIEHAVIENSGIVGYWDGVRAFGLRRNTRLSRGDWRWSRCCRRRGTRGNRWKSAARCCSRRRCRWRGGCLDEPPPTQWPVALLLIALLAPWRQVWCRHRLSPVAALFVRQGSVGLSGLLSCSVSAVCNSFIVLSESELTARCGNSFPTLSLDATRAVDICS